MRKDKGSLQLSGGRCARKNTIIRVQEVLGSSSWGGQGRVRRTREVVGQKGCYRSQEWSEMSRHMLRMENSMSLKVAAVCKIRESDKGRQGQGERIREGP